MFKWIFTPIFMLVTTNFDTNKYMINYFWLSSMHVADATWWKKALFCAAVIAISASAMPHC